MTSAFSHTVLRNSIFGAAAQFAIKVLSFGFSVLIVRRLGVEDFGQYAAILAFGAIFVFISDLGLSPYAVRAIARLRDQPEGIDQIQTLYGNIALLRFMLSLVAAALIILTAWLTQRPPVMILAISLNTIGLMLYSLQGASDSILAGFERLDISSSARVLNQLIFVGLGAIALVWHGGYFGLIAANLLAIGATTYVCWYSAQQLGIRPRQPDMRRWAGLLRASIPFGIIGLTLGLSYKFDSVLLNIFWGNEATGYYNAAYNLVFSTVVISNVFSTSLYPSLARQSINSPASLKTIYGRALRYSLGVALPIAVGGAILAEPLVQFLFGEVYTPAAPALRIVIWVVPLMFMTELCGYMVLINGAERKVARSVLLSTSVNVALNLALVPRYGFMAAAVMTVVTECILFCQYVWLLRSQISLDKWKTVIIRPLGAATAMGLVVYWMRDLPVIFVILCGVGVYATAGLVTGVVGKEEIGFVRFWWRQRQHAEPVGANIHAHRH